MIGNATPGGSGFGGGSMGNGGIGGRGGGGGGRRNRRNGRLWRNRWGDEARAQEPVVGAARDAAAEQIVSERPGAQFAIREREGAGRRRRPIDRLDDRNAVRDCLRAWAGRVPDIKSRRACRRAPVNDDPIGWRAVVAEKSVEHDSAAHTGIVDGRQRLVAGELRRVANGRREDDRARIGVGEAGDVRTAGHVPDCAALQRHIGDAADRGRYRARE